MPSPTTRRWARLALAAAVGVLLAGTMAVGASSHTGRHPSADAIAAAGVRGAHVGPAGALAGARRATATASLAPGWLSGIALLSLLAAAVALGLDGTIRRRVRRGLCGGVGRRGPPPLRVA
ncbi:MAG TPA: hypothetical protein VFA94_16515 [Acidimicrobiales bacterium]|nr:hypothetical protein [Acidimicrobiales bacterium]